VNAQLPDTVAERLKTAKGYANSAEILIAYFPLVEGVLIGEAYLTPKLRCKWTNSLGVKSQYSANVGAFWESTNLYALLERELPSRFSNNVVPRRLTEIETNKQR
jgi:hypothetical protein